MIINSFNLFQKTNFILHKMSFSSAFSFFILILVISIIVCAVLINNAKEGLDNKYDYNDDTYGPDLDDVENAVDNAYVYDISYTVKTDNNLANYQLGPTVSYTTNSKALNDTTILPLTGYDTKFNSFYYDQNNYDVQYHDSKYDDDYGMGDKGTWVKNTSGKLDYVKWTDISNYSTYFKPGAFKFGPSNYVPSYEDAVYLNYNTNKQNVVYEK